MDPNNLIHYIINGVLIVLLGIASFFFKHYIFRITSLEEKFAAHDRNDAEKHARLETQGSDVLRRLDSIEAKLDKLLNK